MGANGNASFPCHFALFLFLLVPYGSSGVSVESVDVHAAKHLISSGNHRFLDVRSAEEFYEGHIKDAINIPYVLFTKEGKVKNPKFLEQVSAIYDKDDSIVVGCLVGIRSIRAAEVLTNAGFKHVMNMDGGYEAWVKSGFAVVDKPRSEL